tara:strand:+ start:317 stop:598 length:282 start_codon:yes stop_codon:yes gene_type:complete
MENWNTLGVKTDDYYSTFEYSENFDNFFGTIAAKSLRIKREPTESISSAEAQAIYDKYSKLKFELDTYEIKLDTQEKADKILNELQEVVVNLS